MARKTSPRSYGFSQRILKCGSDYFKTSSLHGFRNIALEENNYFERYMEFRIKVYLVLLEFLEILVITEPFGHSSAFHAQL